MKIHFEAILLELIRRDLYWAENKTTKLGRSKFALNSEKRWSQILKKKNWFA